MSYVQRVDIKDQPNIPHTKYFSMIDNYIYLYHTDTLIVLPVYPESIDDTMSVSFQETSVIGRSAPIFTYSGSGPRNLNVQLPLHRDMMNEINTGVSRFSNYVPNLERDDYVDIMVKQLQSAALPLYAADTKRINPPLVAVRFGNSIFCKGVVNGQVSVTHSGPIISYPDGTERYALVTVGFSVTEVDPYDAESVMVQGGFRGLRSSLQEKEWK